MFNYFLNNGYYRTKEDVYKKSAGGKISWKRTIKQIKSVLSNENVSYIEFISKKTNYSDEELISKIYRFCVYESFQKIGCLFTSFCPRKPHIKFQKKLFSSFLKREISETFNDSDRELFKNMLAIVLQNESDGNICEYFYGTNEFHYIWEKLVDSAFGNMSKDESLHPHIFWKIEGHRSLTSTLIPDTLTESYSFDSKLNAKPDSKKIYILDAKYYRAGNDLESASLPAAESVPKQIVYAERIKTKKIAEPKNIFNAFILPFESSSGKSLEYLGFVEPDWIEPDLIKAFSFYKIQGIKIDTRFLMQHHFKDNNFSNALMNMIEEKVRG